LPYGVRFRQAVTTVIHSDGSPKPASPLTTAMVSLNPTPPSTTATLPINRRGRHARIKEHSMTTKHRRAKTSMKRHPPGTRRKAKASVLKARRTDTAPNDKRSQTRKETLAHVQPEHELSATENATSTSSTMPETSSSNRWKVIDLGNGVSFAVPNNPRTDDAAFIPSGVREPDFDLPVFGRPVRTGPRRRPK
jgi:hypothetical protein